MISMHSKKYVVKMRLLKSLHDVSFTLAVLILWTIPSLHSSVIIPLPQNVLYPMNYKVIEAKYGENYTFSLNKSLSYIFEYSDLLLEVSFTIILIDTFAFI